MEFRGATLNLSGKMDPHMDLVAKAHSPFFAQRDFYSKYFRLAS